MIDKDRVSGFVNPLPLTPPSLATELNPDKAGKEINHLSQHESFPGQTLLTRNHEVIKAWAHFRQAKPCVVPDTGLHNSNPYLCFRFPDYSGEELREISWDEWLNVFAKNHSIFLYQEHSLSGELSHYFEIETPTV